MNNNESIEMLKKRIKELEIARKEIERLIRENDRLKEIEKEYEKISKLSQEEKQAILPWLVRYNCRMFAEFYEHCFEGKVSDEGCLKWTIDTTKGAIKELGWKI